VRVNVDLGTLCDVRFSAVAVALGLRTADVLGCMVRLWMRCNERRSDILTGAVIDGLAEHRGFAAALAADPDPAMRLADRREDGSYRVRGVASRMGWLHAADERRAKMNAARAGRKTPASSSVESSLEPSLESRVDLSPAPAPAPAPALVLSSHSESPRVTGAGAPESDDAKRTRKTPAHKLPAVWEPTAAHRALAQQLVVDCHYQAGLFRDHAETHDRKASNWDAAFRTWLKKAAEYRRARGQDATVGFPPPREL